MKISFCILLLVLATLSQAQNHQPKFVCDREMLLVTLDLKSRCCGNKWPYQLVVEVVRENAGDILNVDFMAVGSNVLFGDGLSKDVHIDENEMKDMERFVACFERLIENNAAFGTIIGDCDKKLAAHKAEKSELKQSKCVCLIGELFQNCPELMADLTGDYSKLGSMDSSNFGF